MAKNLLSVAKKLGDFETDIRWVYVRVALRRVLKEPNKALNQTQVVLSDRELIIEELEKACSEHPYAQSSLRQTLDILKK